MLTIQKPDFKSPIELNSWDFSFKSLLWQSYIKFILGNSHDLTYFAKHRLSYFLEGTKGNQNVCETVSVSTGFVSRSLRNRILPWRQAILGKETICVTKPREVWLGNKPEFTEELGRRAGVPWFMSHPLQGTRDGICRFSQHNPQEHSTYRNSAFFGNSRKIFFQHYV